VRKIWFSVVLAVLFFGAFFGTLAFFEREKGLEFSGESINGRVNLASFRGENLIFYFGYTSCPDVCPTSLSLVGEVLRRLGREDVKVIFVSVDEADDVKSSDEFAKYFYKNSVAVKFTPIELARVAKVLGVKYEKVALQNSVLGYTMAHSSSIYIFDKAGVLVGEVSNLVYEEVATKLKEMLR